MGDDWTTVVIDDRLLAKAKRAGATGQWKAKRPLPGGEELRVMWGHEPFLDFGEIGLHVSVSVSNPENLGPTRRPTDQECRLAIDHAKQWRFITLKEENQLGSDPCVRQFWQT